MELLMQLIYGYGLLAALIVAAIAIIWAKGSKDDDDDE